jgi:outer membrane protein assembly factor BamD
MKQLIISTKRLLSTLITAISLLGCAKSEQAPIITDPKGLYNTSVELVKKEDFSDAIKNFTAIESDFPASKLATNSNIMRCYALYLKGDLIESIFAAEDFIKRYPADPNLDYMYYMKAICEYDQIVDVERDQKQTLIAKKALEELVNKFPKSKYAKDTKQKLLYTHNSIAGKEMAIAHSNLSKGELIPALVRYKTVIKEYDDTIFVEEALYRFTEIYLRMGLKEEAKLYAIVLGYNYPASEWYKLAYKLINSAK